MNEKERFQVCLFYCRFVKGSHKKKEKKNSTNITALQMCSNIFFHVLLLGKSQQNVLHLPSALHLP